MKGPDLFVATREHDMPPRWDGLAVRWTPWEPQLVGFICPPPKTRPCCSRCGSPHPPVVARGYIARSAVVTPEMLAANDAARDRLPFGQRHRVKPLALLRLHAFRCQDCRHDEVWDRDTDELFDLDPTDYGDEGSVAP